MYLFAWRLITECFDLSSKIDLRRLLKVAAFQQLDLSETRFELVLLLQRKNSLRAPRGSVRRKWTAEARAHRLRCSLTGEDVRRRGDHNHYEKREPGHARLVEIADPEEADDVRKKRRTKKPEIPFLVGIADNGVSSCSNP